MALMEWKEVYSVGSNLLDTQHRQLIDLVNDLDGDVDLGEVLAGLCHYGEAHFRDEEALMAAAEYPEIDRHRSQHKAFRAWLENVVALHGSGGDAAVARRDVHSYLKVWLANHLLVFDQALQPYLEQGRAEPGKLKVL